MDVFFHFSFFFLFFLLLYWDPHPCYGHCQLSYHVHSLQYRVSDEIIKLVASNTTNNALHKIVKIKEGIDAK